MSRGDLLALTPDSLAALANRGLVKRAQKEIDAGKGPVLEEFGGTVIGRFDGGVVAELPPNTPLSECSCSCGAQGVCRHRIAVALAYPAWQSAQGASGEASDAVSVAEQLPPFEAWSPGSFSDDEVQRFLGKRVWERAKVLRRKGLVAEVRRPTREDPVPTVNLATCTVRFLVPNDLSYVVTDAAEGVREPIALAVWAFRAADGRDDAAPVVELELSDAQWRPAVEIDAMEPALSLGAELVLEGVVHTGTGTAGHFERVRQRLLESKLTWPADALDDLQGQLSAYMKRTAWYAPAAVARLIVELFAR
ncbi:MAG: SWIM zinc finger family protein, partial [Myxococcota bacterium]